MQDSANPWTEAARRAAQRLPVSYGGRRSELFGLALRTGLLSLATLGLYRFWERTRIRRYVWSSVRIGDDPFTYVGTGLEKLLGFFVAVIILAIVLGVVQTVLFFSGLTLFSLESAQADLWIGLGLAQLSFLVVLPLVYFARYRARRYRMARTRWRCIRFGMEPGAGGYAWRGVLYLFLAVVSVGLLWPLLTYRLEKYRTDRTFFGQARFSQGGSWGMLYGSMRHFLYAAVATFILFWIFLPAAVVVGPLWMAFGFVYYRVDSFRRLAVTKRLIVSDHEEVTFKASPRVWRVLRYLFLGGLVVVVLGAIMSGLYVALLAGLGIADLDDPQNLTGISLPQLVVSLMGVLVALTVYGSLALVFIVQPILAHVVSTLEVQGADAFSQVRQRERDSFADADGFASALDLGGAF